jgi:dihydrofolate synthase/folylpolyglutamate synthase
LGLDRIEALLRALGSPHQAQQYVHVAGTNGKGSTCAMIERTLREQGQKTGLYISPHLVEPTERIQVAGRPVSAEEFTRAFSTVHEAAETLMASGGIDAHPTYFETMTAMAHWLFRESGVEVAVLETGMGGRLDATNVVDPLLSVITPIDFDHEQYLGDTIPRIAYEKAGILKPGRRAVFSRQRPEALAVLERTAQERGCAVAHASAWRAERLEVSAYGSRFTATGPRSYGVERSIEVECPLIGAHQVENALTAVSALVELGVESETIRRGIRQTAWPGRLELVRRAPDLFLDGAHNPAGANALADYIREFHAGRKVWVVFGAMRDKDLSVIGPLLFPLADELIFTAPAQARAFSPEELRAVSGETRARLAASPAEALRLLEEAGVADVAFVTGSLYLVGEVRPLLVG